jgi:MT0933-like antitoxin protein
MGLTDKLKDLKGKAEDAVVERHDQIQHAVEKAGAAADKRTGGKYHEKIQKVGDKAVGLVDSLKEPAAQAAGEQAGGGGRDAGEGSAQEDAQ